jgi:hypothetical protein
MERPACLSTAMGSRPEWQLIGNTSAHYARIEAIQQLVLACLISRVDFDAQGECSRMPICSEPRQQSVIARKSAQGHNQRFRLEI